MKKIKLPRPRILIPKNKGGKSNFVTGYAYVFVDGETRGRWVKFKQGESSEASVQDLAKLWEKKRKQKDRRRRRFLKKEKKKIEKIRQENLA